MPKPVDAHPASLGARRTLYQVYTRDSRGKTFKVGLPAEIELVVDYYVEAARLALSSKVPVFWVEEWGVIDLSETETYDPARATLAVSQLPEPDRRGAVDSGRRVCAGLRRPVTPQEIEKQIIREIEKWIAFCLWAIAGGIVGVLGYVFFVVE